MKHFLSLLSVVILTVGTASAQESDEKKPRVKTFDAGITLGTTGLGADVGWKASDWLRLRGGFSFMPHWSYKMNFGIQIGDNSPGAKWKAVVDADGQQKYNADGTPMMERTDPFGRMANYLKDLTGLEVDDNVDMIGKPLYWNVKVLADFYPLRDKRWRITAGVFVGNNKIAKAYNTTEDMASLMAVSIYNNLYDKAYNDQPFVTVGGISVYNSDLQDRLLKYGRMGIHLGDYSHDILDEDGNVVHQKGEAYMMEPDQNSMAKAKVMVNSVKPYVGLGFDGKLSNNGLWTIGVDAGVMLWGGTPKVVTHDGTDLINDVENVGGKVGDYIDLMKKAKVMPVLELRIARKLF